MIGRLAAAILGQICAAPIPSRQTQNLARQRKTYLFEFV